MSSIIFSDIESNVFIVISKLSPPPRYSLPPYSVSIFGCPRTLGRNVLDAKLLLTSLYIVSTPPLNSIFLFNVIEFYKKGVLTV